MDNNDSSEALLSRPFELEGPDGRRISGCVEAPPADGLHPTLICLHGFRSHMDWGFFPDFARRAVAAGWCVVRFSFSGSGVPAGADRITDLAAFANDTYGKQLEDLELVHAALDAGELLGADPRRWSILGHSRGSGIGLIHAAERGDARAFIGWAQITTPGSWSAETKSEWRATGVHRIRHGRGGGHLELGTELLNDLDRQAERYDLYARARELTCPALLLHGDRDIAISAAEGRTIYESMTHTESRFRLLPRTGHTFGVRHPMDTVPEAYEQLADESLAFLAAHGR